MNFTLASIVWSLSLLLTFSIVVKMFVDWVCTKDDKLRTKTKVIMGIIALISFAILLVSFHHMLNPNSDRKNEVVSITNISEVYKSNIDAEGNEDDFCYYVVKENDTKLYEIVVDKVLKGDGNYVITKEYSNKEISNELVLKDKKSIKTLPKYNK